MANLETLELTINANAESASKGLENLINSLTALSKKVGKCVGGLKNLNAQLSTLKGFSNIKFTGIEKAAKDVKEAVDIPTSKLDALKLKMEGVSEALEKAAGKGNKLSVANRRLQQFTIEKQIDAETKALERQTQAVKEEIDLANNNNRGAVNKAGEGYNEETWRAAYKAKQDAYYAAQKQKEEYYAKKRLERAIKNNPVVKALENGRQASSYVQDYINQSMGIGAAPKSAEDSASAFMEQSTFIEKVKTAFSKLSDGVKTAKEQIGQMIPKFHLLNRVMRIASTMMIRMGIRALFKGAKEGLENYYQYAKANNSAIAQSMDSMYSSWSQLKNQMGAAIAPAISAAIPVINALASAAITAFNALSQLFALLTGRGTWSKATEGAKEFGDSIKQATGGGGGGIKELLAQFDELNVITSESGGGGGGAAAAADAYEDMFEEMSEFDKEIERIANAIKDVVGWIRDNIAVILESVGLIGLAILGWKISKAFEGVLSTIGTWIAGGALITLGIVLDFDFGKKIGRSIAGDYNLNWADIVEGVAGIVAAGIGGYMIGGGTGAAVGIGISVVAMITGIAVELLNKKNALKWGNLELTHDQIQKLVTDEMKFDAYAEIRITDAKLKNVKNAKSHLEDEIRDFSNSLAKIKLNIDASPEAIENAKESVDKIKKELESYLTESAGLIDILFSNLDFGDDKETKIQKDVFTADSEIMQYISEQGKKIADLYDQGMKDGWKNNEAEQIIELMEHLENIFDGANIDEQTIKFLTASKAGLSNVTQKTIDEVWKEQQKIFSDYENTAKESVQEAINSLYYRAKIAENAGKTELAQQLRDDADFMLNNFEEAVSNKLSDGKNEMKNEWIATLLDVYGSDYNRQITNHIGKGFEKELQSRLRESESSAKALLTETIGRVLKTNHYTQQASEMFDIKGWDLLGNSAKQKFFDAIYRAVGVDGVNLLKSSLNISAFELVDITEWSQFSVNEKVQFIRALTDAYGSYEALQAVKSAGIDIDTVLAEGLATGEPTIIGAVNTIKKKMNDELMLKELGKNIANAAEETAKKMTENLSIIAPDVRVPYNWGRDLSKTAENVASGVERAIEAINPQIVIDTSVNAKVSAVVDAIINVIPTQGKVVSTAASGVSSMRSTIVDPWKNLGWFASGAYDIPSGQMFIAGESGPELVGTIDGKTSVANQGQIVEGIAAGVAASNEEQNVLLREQNSLLRSILEKDNSVRIGASTAFGRVAKQSLEMYSNLVGG